jgi:adenine phosphoribosyltransferase
MDWAEVVDHRGDLQLLGVRRDLLRPGDRVLVVDDWAATGAQAQWRFFRTFRLVGVSRGAG